MVNMPRMPCLANAIKQGNGGFAGTIDYASMLSNLNSGYAVGG